MSDLRRIGACENSQAQPDWTGPKIPHCTQPATYLCDCCGHLLCGDHASGHEHPKGQTGQELASRYQSQLAESGKQLDALKANNNTLHSQLKAAQASTAALLEIKNITTAALQ